MARPGQQQRQRLPPWRRVSYAGWWKAAEELVHDLREVFGLDPEKQLDMVTTSDASRG